MGAIGDWVSQLPQWLLGLDPIWVYLVVAVLVFAEDAVFVGFVIPGETAAVLGGVSAALGHTQIAVVVPVVVAAAILGDSVGFEVGKHFLGPKVLERRIFDRFRRRIHSAQEFLRRRGGAAVFLGRFTAFFRAVMPALAGMSRMRYPRFLVWNATGGLVWGAGYALIGYLAGSSYKQVAHTVGRDSAIGFVVIVVLAVLVWHFRRKPQERRREGADRTG